MGETRVASSGGPKDYRLKWESPLKASYNCRSFSAKEESSEP